MTQRTLFGLSFNQSLYRGNSRQELIEAIVSHEHATDFQERVRTGRVGRPTALDALRELRRAGVISAFDESRISSAAMARFQAQAGRNYQGALRTLLASYMGPDPQTDVSPRRGSRDLDRQTTEAIEILLGRRADVERSGLLERLRGNPELMDRVRRRFIEAAGDEGDAVRWLTRAGTPGRDGQPGRGVAGRGITADQAIERLNSTDPAVLVRTLLDLRNGRVRRHFRDQGIIGRAEPSEQQGIFPSA
jgi:hypothetical protein